jgi:hypothetical protein
MTEQENKPWLCEFCNKQIKVKDYFAGDCGSFVCNDCGVTWQSDIEDGIQVKFDRRIDNGVRYCLSLYPERNKTVLIIAMPNPNTDPWSYSTVTRYTYDEIELKECMEGVTPQNILDKIKMILIFR